MQSYPQRNPNPNPNLQLLTNDEDEGPSAQDALEALVSAEGDIYVAAEALFGLPKPNQMHPRAKLVSLLVSNPMVVEDLQKQLRLLSLIQAYQSVRLVGVTVDGTLDKLQSADRARLYNSLLQVVATLTDDHTSNTNLNANLNLPDAVLSNLNPEEREALKVLMMPIQGSNQTPTPIDETEFILPERTQSHPQQYAYPDSSIPGILGSPPPNAADGTDI